MKKALLPFFFFASLGFLSRSQDMNFTQYSFTPQVVNPASISADGYLSVSMDYRSQKLTSDLNLKTMSLFAKYPFYNKEGRRIAAFGIGFLGDQQAQNIDMIKTNGISGVFSYNLTLSEKWSLSSGIGAAYSRTEVSNELYSTGSQWIPNVGYVPDAPNGETFENLQTNYFSLNAGLQIYQEDRFGWKHYLGISAFHFNKPNASLIQGESIIPIRYSVQAGFRVFQSARFAIAPEAIYNQQGGNSFISAGAVFSYLFENTNPYDPVQDGSIDLRIRNVINESIVMAIQINQPSFSFGFSYDVGLASSSESPANSTTEFAFTIRKKLLGKQKTATKTISNYSVGEIRDFYDSKKIEAKKVEQASSKTPEPTLHFELEKDFEFGFNETKLDESDKAYLNDLVNLLKQNDDLKLEVIGHADDRGSDKVNQRISMERAAFVKEYIVEQGVDKARIKTTAIGATEPLFPNNSDENRAKNRRVEFNIYKNISKRVDQ